MNSKTYQCFTLWVGRYSVMLLCTLCPDIALAAQDTGPETMNLVERFEIAQTTQPPVILDHRLHQKAMDQKCESCHQDPDGGSPIKFELEQMTGVRNDFHANFCWPCHDQMGTDVGKRCTTCHVRN